MAELIILAIGAFISALLAFLKVTTIISMGWFGVFVPLIISVVLIAIMWIGVGDGIADGVDFDFDI